MMVAQVPPLVEVLRAVPEGRGRSGRRHPLVAMLATACAAMRCGARGSSAIAEWGRDYAATSEAGAAGADAIAIDGTTPRGRRTQGAPGVHLLSAVSHRLGLTLGQAGVDEKTNEIPVAPVMLAGLLLEGRIVTMDALLTQREVAQTIIAGGGDYMMPVKENQPSLYQASDTLFAPPVASAPRPAATRPG